MEEVFMSECNINVEKRNGVHILQVDGSVNPATYPQLENHLRALYEKDHCNVIMDCKRLNYIHSAAIGALIHFARNSQQQNGCLKLVNLSPRIRNIVEILGFNKILEIDHDLEQVLHGFSQTAD